MRVKGITLEQLQTIVRNVNHSHGSHIQFGYAPEPVGKWIQFTLRMPARWQRNKAWDTNPERDKFRRFTDSPLRGGTRYNSGVCFHGHWQVYREIFVYNPNAVIVTAFARYNSLPDLERLAPTIGDRNIGSIMYPLYLDSACDCGE